MARTKSKIRLLVRAILLLAAVIVILLVVTSENFSSKGRLRLPVGPGSPAISLGERHGLILASDGSLWSWGSDFAGWPVLGLGNLNRTTKLRRIGNDTDWINIAAGKSYNLAIKSDGT